MNNAVLIQHAYKGRGFEPMLELTQMHHRAYCDRYGLDYWPEVFIDERYPDTQGAWIKILLIQKAMSLGYEYIIWLDADTLIVDFEIDLCEAVQRGKIGASWHRIPQLDHWNVGALYVHNHKDTRAFIEEWLAAYPPPKDGWYEQGVFNRMGKQSRVVSTLSDKWNSTIDVNMVPDAVVLGFHGQGNAEYRYKLMQDTYNQLFPVTNRVMESV